MEHSGPHPVFQHAAYHNATSLFPLHPPLPASALSLLFILYKNSYLYVHDVYQCFVFTDVCASHECLVSAEEGIRSRMELQVLLAIM